MPARLLLADDSITIQRVIELTFADEDVTVTAVPDGDAAIAYLDANRPDIVLADIGMPGRNGYEVAAHVQRTPALAGIPVLLLTGASEPADEARVRALGCAGVLVKPFEPQLVIARVRELLRRQGAGAPDRLSGVPAAASPAGADAVLQPGTPPAPARDVDEYFAELDAAFANLAAAPAPGAPTPLPRAPEPEVKAADREQAAPAVITMAGAFEALLGAEQGEPLPPAIADEATTRQRQEAIAARVASEAAERIVREIAPDLVAQIAERLIREEIDRIRAAAREP